MKLTTRTLQFVAASFLAITAFAVPALAGVNCYTYGNSTTCSDSNGNRTTCYTYGNTTTCN